MPEQSVRPEESGLRARWDEFAAQALCDQASYADLLAELLESECEDRDARRKSCRVKETNSPGRNGSRTSISRRTPAFCKK
ncbi:MAG TPA: hypothetical protein VN520_21970 [Streptomyces sp.]|uniref:hypothetical protein n=1 Tax=Streptomyces sp. TaxID=1931 RepID=UPI002CF7E377|nr:hypothetical protein [Streptomyces sp.]HWU09015.1 hypothetical protein [Streptomyces sp.]